MNGNTANRFFSGLLKLTLGMLCLAGVEASRVTVSADSDGFREAIDQAVAQVKPALVRIQVVSTYYREGRELKRQSVGSGVIISPEGHLVTNHHVAGHGTRFFCTLASKEEVEARLIGTDPMTDIAVLKLDPASSSRTFPVAGFGDSTRVKVGDPVLAMGSPMALSQSVTLGIVSNTEMIMPEMFGPFGRIEQDGENVGALVRWIGHDAAIYGGNSGGPLVNRQGEIIGINEIRMGLSGAIPGILAQSVARRLIEDGRVQRSWLGLEIQPLLKSSSDDQRGVLVSGVLNGSPADQAGLQSGDRLLKLAGTPIEVRYEEQLPELVQLIADLPIGKPVTAKILRNDQQRELEITPVEREEFNPPQKELQAWGMTVQNLSFFKARELQRQDQQGVLVTSVRPGGPAGTAKPSISPQCILVELKGRSVPDVQSLIRITRETIQDREEPVPVLAAFERNTKRFLTVVELGIEELRRPGREVRKAWLPVETQVISRDIARHLERPDLRGFAVTHVYAETPAAKAGLRPADFITGVDGRPLSASAPEHYEELETLIRQYPVGATVELTVLRDNRQITVPVELIRTPRPKREMEKYRSVEFGFTARNLAFFDKAENQWVQDQSGVLVQEVQSGSWAELASLYVNDLIVAVDGKPVEDTQMLKKRLEKAVAEEPQFVVMKVMRGIHTRFLELEPDWD